MRKIILFVILVFTASQWGTLLNEPEGGRVEPIISSETPQKEISAVQKSAIVSVHHRDAKASAILEKQVPKNKIENLETKVKSVEQQLTSFRYPFSLESGHLNPQEEVTVIALLEKREQLKTKILKLKLNNLKRGTR